MALIEVVVLPGDGVGPEVTAAMRQVLEAVARKSGHELDVEEYPVGFAAYAEEGAPISEAALDACRKGPAVFLGAVGDPRADDLPHASRPEAALLRLRSELGCYANLRPVSMRKGLAESSALRAEVVASCDFVIVRELMGGLYYGTPRVLDENGGRALNTLVYEEAEIERISRIAFDLALGRRRHVASVDKANVLEVSRLWRSVVARVSSDYPEVTLEHVLVDRAAMELVLDPGRFDVILTENMFGDILSDEAAAVCGTLGTLPSASIGGRVGLYEPVHGSAPELAGKDVANPLGAIRSAAMMLSHSFGMHEEAAAVEDAISSVLADGLRTFDLCRNGQQPVGTRAFATAVAGAVS